MDAGTPLPRATRPAPIGGRLRAWRRRRRLSQLDLALDAGISQRHLCFVEGGRAMPSRDMVLHLAEVLDVPLRERNALLLAAGFAPRYAERPLDDPALAAARAVVDAILHAHAPNPALAVDRHWHMLAANAAVPPLLAGVTEPALLEAPVNVLRLSLHPGGLAPAIANLPEWRAHVLARLRRQVQGGGDPALADLLAELAALGRDAPEAAGGTGPAAGEGIAVPLELDTAEGRLALISTATVFGTPTEVTLAELSIEAFYPADGTTAEPAATGARRPGVTNGGAVEFGSLLPGWARRWGTALGAKTAPRPPRDRKTADKLAVADEPVPAVAGRGEAGGHDRPADRPVQPQGVRRQCHAALDRETRRRA